MDSLVHAQRSVADTRRDQDLGLLGYLVLRIPAAVVMQQRAHAIALVRRAVEALAR